MKCFNCKEEFEKPKYGRSKSILILLFLFFFPGWIFYLIIKPQWICPHCGNKVVKTEFNKVIKKKDKK
jgi:DNA-directed RNA polymerase subunit RPC12/RpoP